MGISCSRCFFTREIFQETTLTWKWLIWQGRFDFQLLRGAQEVPAATHLTRASVSATLQKICQMSPGALTLRAKTRAAHISLQKPREPWLPVGSHHTEHPYREKPLLGCGAPWGACTTPTTCTAERSPCCYGNISDISGTCGLLQNSPSRGFWVCFFIKSKFCSCSYFCEVLFSKHHWKAC